MYRYARTRNRVHRVVIEGGRAFKVENCNLDDVGFLNLVDIIPEGTRCAWCWAGYVEPTPEQKAAESAENAKREESLKNEIPPNAKAIPLVTSTRRMAAAVLVGALLLGAATGVVASPKAPDQPDQQVDALIADLRGRIDDLFVQVRILDLDINGHTHTSESTSPPLVIVIPSFPPNDSQVIKSPDPAPIPTSAPSTTPIESPAADIGRRTTTDTITRNSTTIIVVPVSGPIATLAPLSVTPPPTPAPTPAPTPCVRPGVAIGLFDRCKGPQLR